MGLFSSLKDKVSSAKEPVDTKTYEEDMRNLDSLIEDLFKLDEKSLKENVADKKE
ncbi:MAG: hypothetical protein JSW33_16380 [bacterium]|nr:MAG: hypothetical protein JSW33_16380 [bacterium]